MNEISELQRRRAVNMIWNGACDHSFTPDIKVYDRDGKADIYWNTVIGAVRRHYDYPKIEAVLRSFAQYEDSEIYESLLWLGLENAVFGRELSSRPALEGIRKDYARRYLAENSSAFELDLLSYMSLAHYRRVLGLDPGLDAFNESLLDELEFPPELTTDEIVERAGELFLKWFRIRARECAEEKKREKKKISLFRPKKTPKKGRLRKFGLGFAERRSDTYGGGLAGEQGDGEQLVTKMSAEELRAFMETKYGKSAFSARETAELERSICTGNHSVCHVLITRGEKGNKKIQNGFEALQREREAKQIEKNREFYLQNLPARRTAIDRLSNKIRNSVLMHLQAAQVRSDSGALDGARVWRACLLNDERVFTRIEQDNMGELCVDILLDASTSQKNRQEMLSNQGRVIAESLDRCGIPCRVMSFCSMTGYTIVRIFRDYSERGKNDGIFEFVSNGCNRDGLAIRMAHELIMRQSCEHRVLILLSDAKPNDVCRMKTGAYGEMVNYEKEAGIRDTAVEVRSAKADGISVICVFTGDDDDLPAAKLIYGRDFARIQSIDVLADTVGMLLQNQIKNM